MTHSLSTRCPVPWPQWPQILLHLCFPLLASILSMPTEAKFKSHFLQEAWWVPVPLRPQGQVSQMSLQHLPCTLMWGLLGLHRDTTRSTWLRSPRHDPENYMGEGTQWEVQRGRSTVFT
jgi:hypothetical protein